MTKNTVSFGGDDSEALEYIRKRGYVSYSSLVNVRDKKSPEPFVETPYYRFGKELHSRYLEGKIIEILSNEEEELLTKCLKSLRDNAAARKILTGAQCEVEFDESVKGVRTYGRIDILNTTLVGDLKTTRHNKMLSFAPAMDFLQAALYLEVSKKKDFFYVGISKVSPHPVLVFSVKQYPQRLQQARYELYNLLKYVKSKL